MSIISCLTKKVDNIFYKHNFNYDSIVDINGNVFITIDNGDWKHDHRRLINIMEAEGFILVERTTIDSDDDCFSAEYTFIERYN